jgi:hypothetical protein
MFVLTHGLHGSWSSFAGRVMKDSRQWANRFSTRLGSRWARARCSQPTAVGGRRAGFWIGLAGGRKPVRANCPCTLSKRCGRLVAPRRKAIPQRHDGKRSLPECMGQNPDGQPAARSVHGEFTLYAIFDQVTATSLLIEAFCVRRDCFLETCFLS